MDIMCINNEICHLAEGPIWNMQLQKLFWTDIYKRQIWVWNPIQNVSSVYWKGDLQVGGFAFSRKGDLILFTDKGIYLLSTDTEDIKHAKPKKIFEIPLLDGEMFNDITVDPRGRIFAGTILRPKCTGGTLYRIEKGKVPVAVLKDLGCSNGMTFSMDEKYFFHTDSKVGTITKYDYDQETGEISNPNAYFTATGGTGSPDGITLDVEGNIWSAFWGGGCIRRIDKNGNITVEIKVLAKQPSSVMFGGDNLEELYITTACENADNINTGYCEDGTFLGGLIYKVTPGVRGRAEWLADF